MADEPTGTVYLLLREVDDGASYEPIATTRLRPNQAARAAGEGAYVAVALSSWTRVVAEARITARGEAYDASRLPELSQGTEDEAPSDDEPGEADELAATIEGDVFPPLAEVTAPEEDE